MTGLRIKFETGRTQKKKLQDLELLTDNIIVFLSAGCTSLSEFIKFAEPANQSNMPEWRSNLKQKLHLLGLY